MQPEDIVRMALDAARWRYIRKHEAFQDVWGSDTPEQFDADVDAFIQSAAMKADQE